MLSRKYYQAIAAVIRRAQLGPSPDYYSETDEIICGLANLFAVVA